jgi:acetyltransferase-like isoleucine patch superfamily enzyme
MKGIIKIARYMLFNKIHNTRIKSKYASLKASYGVEVGVAYNSYVESDVTIGDYSYINANSYIENCEIGKFCSISSGVYISPFEHNNNFRTTHPIIFNKEYGFIRENYKMNRKKVIIGNDVLISLNAVILEGVIIGNGAVIGAGAVVTKDVEPYEVVGGVPAKHIKYRFNVEERENLQKIKFWDWGKQKIVRNIDYLRNISNSIV